MRITHIRKNTDVIEDIHVAHFNINKRILLINFLKKLDYN
jgi:hypothetical protein